MNNKDQHENGAVNNNNFAATPNTSDSESNKESPTSSGTTSGVGRYIPPHLRKKVLLVQENNNDNLENAPVSKRDDRVVIGKSRSKRPAEKPSNHSPSPVGATPQAYGPDGLMPRDIRAERELFPNVESFSSFTYDRLEYDIPVQAFGDDVPAPIQRFEDAELGPVVTNNIGLGRYTTITPIQKYAVPVILEGRDLMAIVETGSGKTNAYLFPIVAKLSRGQTSKPAITKKATPKCLILVPVRELAYGIHHEARKCCYRSHLKTAVVFGGAPVGDQIKQLAHGCDILVATPGRLVDLLDRSVLSLSEIKYFVLEEVDRLLDMGFEPQIRRIVEEKDMPAVGVRQTLLFSATFPKEVQRLAQDFLYDYILLRVGRAVSYNHGLDFLTQKILYVDDDDKHSAIVDTLGAVDGLTLVYVNTKRGAEELNNYLIGIGMPSTCIHGDRNQPEREHALKMFRQGAKPILVATDISARGLEIPNAAHVINYDFPHSVDDYVHRIARTGHAAGKGLATAFFNEKDKAIAKDLVETLEQSGQEVPGWLREYAVEANRGPDNSHRGRGVRGGRGGRGRAGSRGYGARASGRGYGDIHSELPPAEGQNNHEMNDRTDNNHVSFSFNAGSNSGKYSGGSNTNWW